MLLLSLVALALATPTPVAQTASAPVGKLYFNATAMDESSDLECNPIFHYGLEPVLPTNETSQQAFSGPTYFVDGCPTYFAYNATQPILLSGTGTVHFYLACDSPSAYAGTPVTSTVRVRLHQNGEYVTGATVSKNSPTGPCGSTPANISVQLPTQDAEFAVGDLLAIEIIVWAMSPVENVHFLVGSVSHNSSFEAEGLPMAVDPNATAVGPGGAGTGGGKNGTGENNTGGGNGTGGGNNTGGNGTGGGHNTGGNGTAGGNGTSGNRTGNQTGPGSGRGNGTGARPTPNRTTNPTSAADDDAGAKDISAEGEGAPGLELVLISLAVGGAMVWRRRKFQN